MEPMVVIFFLSLNSIIFSGVHSGAIITSITFRNKCGYPLWPAIQRAAGHPQLSSSGIKLSPKETKTLSIASSWSVRMWARSGCTNTSGKFVCQTGDCGTGTLDCDGATIPPATLAEFTFGRSGGKDSYHISLVNGFNLPVWISPDGQGGCESTACAADVNAKCPPELAVKASSGAVIACKSACLKFNQPQYCCTGKFGSPETCQPTSYSLIFKRLCPQAYSYAYDDKSSTFTCPTRVNYTVTICPNSLLYG